MKKRRFFKFIGFILVIYIARYTNLPDPIETVHTIYVDTEKRIEVTPEIPVVPAIDPVKDVYDGYDEDGYYRGWASDRSWNEFLKTKKGIEYSKKHITGVDSIPGTPESKVLISVSESTRDTITVVKTIKQ